MNKTNSNAIVRAAALAAAFAASACATAKPAPAPAKPASSASSASSAVVPSAAAPAPSSAAVPMPTIPLTRVGGVVVSADAAAHTLTIKDYGGRTRAFHIADGAALTKGGDDSAVRLGDLAAGDRVRLKVGGDVVANVHVMVKPAS